MEKDPDSTFIDSLVKLYQNTENHELEYILNYLFHWRLEDPLESVAEAFFSCPPSYMYSVKATVERFRSFETDHKKAYQGFLEKKLSSVICINKHVLNFKNVALLCVAKSLGGL
jgi:hypothetical protein